MKWYYIVLIAIAVVLVLTLVLILIYKRKNSSKDNSDEYLNILLALGGKENIISLDYKNSRVNVFIKDKQVVNKEELKINGIETVVITSKKVTMVVGNKVSNALYNYLDSSIK